ncbi:hypothetical protein GALL_552050 [mine drainage metagenome]|uniref:Uncharacterized protein n=1 Tax=mine drainage metagenome TaxID=410659 RepID=A0A1J5NWX9_9ZZZZ
MHGDKIRIAENGGEQVVEVMGDPSRQHTKAFQLMGLPQSVFRLFALGDVGPDRHELLGPPILADEGHDGRIHPVVAPILRPVLDLPLPHPPRQDRLPELGHEDAGMVARIDDAVVLAQQLLPGILRDGAELVVHVGDPPPGVGDGDDGVLVQRPLEILQFP